MLALDASSIVYAWDNYPIAQFPRLWEWMGNEIATHQISMLSIAYNETCNVSPNCGAWLAAQGIQKDQPSSQILAKALQIKNALGITGDQYGSGVGENDIMIIAHAHCKGLSLISNESKQPSPPANKLKLKIPSVCQLPTANVTCMDFLEYLIVSGAVFG